MTHPALCLPPSHNADFSFPSEFPYGEEDFFAGLTRRLGQTSLHDTRNQLSQVPLSEGSPNGYSRVPSPSTTPFDENNDPWEMIYAAAGQIARMKIMNNNQLPHFDFHPRPQLVRPKQQRCGSVWGRPTKPNNYLVQLQNRAREFAHETVNVKCTPPPLQVHQQSNRVQFGGSGSRAAVPGGGGASSVKRGCGGTGVFLPRQYETPSQPRKKTTGCAPVLLPAKVVHALNLNIDDLNGTNQQRFSNAFATDYDAIIARRNALLMQQQRLLSLRREEAANYEIRLPQEWTY